MKRVSVWLDERLELLARGIVGWVTSKSADGSSYLRSKKSAATQFFPGESSCGGVLLRGSGSVA